MKIPFDMLTTCSMVSHMYDALLNLFLIHSSDESGSSSSDEQETRTVQEPDSTVDQTAAGTAVHNMSTAGRIVQKKGMTGGVQLRPRRRVVAKNKKITTTQRFA